MTQPRLTPTEQRAFRRGNGTISTPTAARLLNTSEDELTAILRLMDANNGKVFNVEGFGQVGMANLDAFVPFPGFKSHRDLEISEVTEGKLQKPGSDHKPERITRIK